MLRRALRGGGSFSSTGAGWGICGANITTKQGGMQGMGQDWWTLGSQLLGTAGSLGTQYLANQAPPPQIIYQQAPAPAPAPAAAPASSSNTLLYVALGAVAVGGVLYFALRKK